MNAIHLYRIANRLYRWRIPFIPGLMRNLIFLLFNSYIPPSATIGRGSVFAYGGIGVVIHADARIGEGCVIGQGVTIGASEGYVARERHACPTIGDHCYIGAGAKILGAIRVGNQCQIGAGAVVIRDVPGHGVVVGVPARLIGSTEADYRAIRT